MYRGLVAAFVASLLMMAAVVGGAPAAAKTAQTSGRLELAGQTAYVSADGAFAMALEWSGTIDPELEVSVIVHGRVSSVAELDDSPGEILDRVRFPVAELSRNEFGQLEVSVPIRSFSPGDPDRLWLEDPGVYPVTVEIRGPDGPLASARTNLIRLPTELAETDFLPVAVLLTVSSADGLTLAAASTLLEKHPTVSVAVFLGDGVVPQLIDDPIAAERFRSALNGRSVLATPELDLDPSALAAIGQGDLYGFALERTEADLASLGLTAVPATHPVEVGLTVAGARLLLDRGVTTVVDIGAVPQPGGFIQVDDQKLSVVQIDDDLTAELAGRSRASTRAHRLLARLAIRSQADRSPVVLGGVNIADAGVNSLDILLSAVDQIGLLETTTINATAGAGLPIRPAESPSQDLQPLAENIAQTVATIGTYENFYISGGIQPQRLRNDLLAALSRDFNPTNRATAVARVDQNIADALTTVSISNSNSVTLAAQQTQIPLQVTNQSAGPRAILLRFETDKLEVENDRVVEIPPGVSQLDIEVRTRSLGLSRLKIIVLTPDGQHELARTTFQVRSTAVPGLGMLLSGTALVLLLVWWWRSIRRTRRKRSPDGAEDQADPEDQRLAHPVPSQ
jgi:hypothetical protein